MKLFGFLALAIFLLQCETEKVIICFPMECSTVATVKDLTGLDGCGFVFELQDGTRLEPEHRTYIQPPKPEEDPLFYYTLKTGEKVQISYNESVAVGSICMVGKVVFITCIKPYGQPATD